jgi:hypothetical protein
MIQAIENNYEVPSSYLENRKRQHERELIETEQAAIVTVLCATGEVFGGSATTNTQTALCVSVLRDRKSQNFTKRSKRACRDRQTGK